MTDTSDDAVGEIADLLLAMGDGVTLPDLSPVIHIGRWPVDVQVFAYRMRSDPTFAVEMRVCETYQIRHSELCSWSEDDRAKAMAYAMHEAHRCGSCGILPEDWPVDAYPPPYQTAVHECAGCAALARQERFIRDESEGHDSARDGLRAVLVRRRED